MIWRNGTSSHHPGRGPRLYERTTSSSPASLDPHLDRTPPRPVDAPIVICWASIVASASQRVQPRHRNQRRCEPYVEMTLIGMDGQVELSTLILTCKSKSRDKNLESRVNGQATQLTREETPPWQHPDLTNPLPADRESTFASSYFTCPTSSSVTTHLNNPNTFLSSRTRGTLSRVRKSKEHTSSESREW